MSIIDGIELDHLLDCQQAIRDIRKLVGHGDGAISGAAVLAILEKHHLTHGN